MSTCADNQVIIDETGHAFTVLAEHRAATCSCVCVGLFNGRPVALKLLMHNHSETIMRVHQEVQITAAVHHDNVAATYCCLVLDKAVLMTTGKVRL